MRISWDCFDTLLARSYKNPRSIFDIVAKKINDPTFPKKRIIAEKHSKLKTYEDIYKLLPEYDPSIEFNTEKEHTFPILENFNKVSDGDVIVSDMYFSSQQILELLNYHNLNKDIDIYVTYSGKHSGLSWNYLRNKYNDITYHIGDNIKSDVGICRANGFKSIFFAGSNFSPEENYISKNNYALATLMRRTRLSNPFFRPYSTYFHSTGSFQNIAGHIWIEEINQIINYFTMHRYVKDDYMVLRSNNRSAFIKINLSGECFYSVNDSDYNRVYEDGKWLEEPCNYEDKNQKLWWVDQSQFNLPILALVSALLSDNEKVVFCQRDCYYLYKIYQSLYPERNNNIHLLDVSRKAYYMPFNDDYISHVLEMTKDAIIVDSHGSGNSANHFFKKYNRDFRLYHICKHPVKKYLVDTNDVTWSNFCERSFFCSGRFLEKFNIHYEGQLIGWNKSAIRMKPEHNKIICDTISSCIEYICKYIHMYSINQDNAALPILIRKLKGTFTEQTVTSIGK